jgi:arylsulfatase A-like enzyme
MAPIASPLAAQAGTPPAFALDTMQGPGRDILRWLVLASALALLWGGRPRPQGQCDDAAAVEQLRNSLLEHARCNEEALLLGPLSGCPTPPPPPGCSRRVAGPAVALAYGFEHRPRVAVDSIALAGQLACQQQLGRALASYLPERLRLRILGHSQEEADALARAEIDAIPAACAVPAQADAASGIVLPDVGLQCEAAVGEPGTPVDAAALRDCLHDLYEVWSERIGPHPESLRPNVIVIMTDDQRWDTLDDTHATPGEVVMPAALGEIANRGVRFDNAYVPTSHCGPSRASFLTGQYAHTHGVRREAFDENDLYVFDDSSTLATWLDAAGYQTGIFGKYQNGWGSLLWDPYRYVPPGWDHWCVFKSYGLYDYSLVENGVVTHWGSDEASYSTDVLRDKALAFLDDAASRGEPFFLLYTPISPHTPVLPAPRHETLFEGLAPFRPPSFNEPDVSDKPAHVRAKGAISEAGIDAVRLGQVRMLRSIDDAVAAFSQRVVRALGIERDTVIVFTTDNGLFWAEHRFTGKNLPYEEALRVPLLLQYPRLAPLPRRDGRMVLNIDLTRTLAELAGAPPARFQDGRSLVTLLDGTAASWRGDFLAEGWPSYPAWAAVREDRWKYVEYATGESELYDLQADPFELQSLHADPQQGARIAVLAMRLRQLRPQWPADVTP